MSSQSAVHQNTTTVDGVMPTSLIQGSDGNLYGTTSVGGLVGGGAVFRATPSGAYSVLYSFLCGTTDGCQPTSLVQGPDGNFYGTTLTGGHGVCGSPPPTPGANSAPPTCGVVFRVTPSGEESVLYFFSGGADGGVPYPQLIVGPDGALYGITADFYGASAGGAVFRVDLAGTESVLYQFSAQTSTDGVNPTSIMLASDGNFYGTTVFGGLNGVGTIYRLTASGAESVLYSFQRGTDAAYPQTPFIQGADGYFYGTTNGGGMYACGTIYKASPNGDESVILSFSGNDGCGPGPGWVQMASGLFYGSAGYSDSGQCSPNWCGIIYSVSPPGSPAITYLFTLANYSGTIIAPAPYALIAGSDGNLYGVTQFGGDLDGGMLFELTPSGVETTLHSFGGTVN
jgi:uncharacterized repeat protein (TIGR03803 family)